MIDNLPTRRRRRDVYRTNSTGGIAASLIGKVTPYGELLPRPNVPNALTIAALTPSTAAPSTATVSVRLRPRYLTAASGV